VKRPNKLDRSAINVGQLPAPSALVELLEIIPVRISEFAFVTVIHNGERLVFSKDLAGPPGFEIWGEEVPQAEDVTDLVRQGIHLLLLYLPV
jgi:hypothetical protein